MGRQAMASTGGTETEMVRSMEQTQHPALRGALTGLVRHAERPAFAHVGADAALGHVRAAAATLRVGEMPARLALMDTTSIVNRAGDVMRGVFYFTKPWDMERCATPFELPANPYEIDWCVVNNDDEEWCFMLNRMDYLEDLAAAFLATGNVEYARHALDLVLAWVAAHPAIEPRLSTRTLDTGIRLRSWARVLPVLEFAGVLGLDSMARILRSAGDQIDYLGERYLPKYETSNWGSIQTCAIVETVLMLAGAGNDEGCYAWALERLASQLPAQVYPDGVDWELSPMYHIEVMLYVLGYPRRSGALRSRGSLFDRQRLARVVMGPCHADHARLRHRCRGRFRPLSGQRRGCPFRRVVAFGRTQVHFRSGNLGRP